MTHPPGPPALRLVDVSLAYGSENDGRGPDIFRGLDLEVGEGEFLAVLGPSGCGKTSLLNLIAGFLEPCSGQVLCCGHEVLGPGPDRAMIFQDSTLFPWLDLGENVAFGLRCRDPLPTDLMDRVDAELSRVGLVGRRKARIHELSGGMRQRAALARVLLLDPPVLLMDEPFGALDASTRERLQEETLHLWEEQRRSIVLVTHNAEEAAYMADRVLFLGPPPGGILYQLEIDLPRPRERNSPELRELVQSLHARSHSSACC